jgi:hypothetical protein
MNQTASEMGVGNARFRFGIAVGLIMAGYVALGLIPVVINSDMTAGPKATLSGLLALSPMLTKIAAVAVMGKRGFKILKAYLFKFLGRFQPPENVSRERYRFGLILFVLSIVFGSLLPYFPGFLVDWKSDETFWSLVNDVLLIISLYLLGGEFWNKLAALFRYDAKVSFPDG